MHHDISTVEEMLVRDGMHLGFEGDGGDLSPFCLPNNKELTDADWNRIKDLSCNYGRRLLVVSGTELWEVTPGQQFKKATAPSDITEGH
jgi:hypothetical protein